MCTKFGGPELLELSEFDTPVADQGQAVIDVKACSINFTDVLMIQDLYQYKASVPFIPGGEVAGLVQGVGSASRAWAWVTRSSSRPLPVGSPSRWRSRRLR